MAKWPVVLATMVSAALGGGCDKPPPLMTELPFQARASFVLVDDVDGNGWPDVVLTSHGGNFSQVFYQQATRRFTAGTPIDVVGFHPSTIIRLPYAEERLYLVSAEGKSALLVLHHGPRGQLDLLATLPYGRPQSTAPFSWPDWGLGLAVLPYGGPTLSLIRGFKPKTGEYEAIEHIDLTSQSSQSNPGQNPSPREVVAADLDGDGKDELVFVSERMNKIYVVRYPGTEPVKTDVLWDFQLPRGQGGFRQVLPFDLDGDGDLDLLVPTQTGLPPSFPIMVLLNDGQGHFTAGDPLPFTGQLGISRIAAAWEQNGDWYIVAAGYADLTLYRFSPAVGKVEALNLPYADSGQVRDLALADLDQDGWQDVVLATRRDNDAGVIIYGPLRDRWRELAEQGYQVGYQVK